jgi:hypothetical protein
MWRLEGIYWLQTFIDVFGEIDFFHNYQHTHLKNHPVHILYKPWKHMAVVETFVNIGF